MIFLGLILPIVIYFFVVKYLFNKFYTGTNKKLRKAIFIGLITLPFWDHIIGYTIYRGLCLVNGGTTIYKTVTDEQEQRDYWFYDGLNVFNNSYKGKEFNFFANNKLVKRGICTKLRKDGVIDERICEKGAFKKVYLNYCNPKYNHLAKTDKNYQASCTNTNAIIKQYDLKNVIKVPKEKYSLGIRGHNKKKVIPFFDIYENYSYGKNIITNEKITEHYGYAFRGGWYIKTFLLGYPYSSYCRGAVKPNKYEKLFNKVGALEMIIPNPYKK